MVTNRNIMNQQKFYHVAILQTKSLEVYSKARANKVIKLFISAKVTNFTRFCKQEPWRGKSVMPVGDYQGITDR